MTAIGPRALGIALVLCIATAGALQAWDALGMFGVRDGTLRWPSIGTYSTGAESVTGDVWYADAVRAIDDGARDGDVLVVLADDANTWTWISYATYPRAWRYASLRAVPAVFPRLPRSRTLVFAELPRAEGVDANAVSNALARQIETFVAQRTVRVVWSDARGAALFEIER